MRIFSYFILLLCFAPTYSSYGQKNVNLSLEIIGNKGARGLMPENTVESMIKALENGVKALKLEVVVSGDKQVVVSQEPYFSSRISISPDGEEITLKDEKKYNIYAMDYNQIKQFDVGSRINDDFPSQEKFRAIKPLLNDLIDKVEFYAKKKKIKNLQYFIETKTIKNGDNTFQPSVGEFVELLMKVIKEKKLEKRMVLYSFDVRSLQYVHEKYPNILTALGVDEKVEFEDNISGLGFNPDYYSPYLPLVGKTLVDKCHQVGIKIIPWTVNTLKSLEYLKNLGVDGVLTDYPNLIKE